MKLIYSTSLLVASTTTLVAAFVPQNHHRFAAPRHTLGTPVAPAPVVADTSDTYTTTAPRSNSRLYVSIGLGPGKEEGGDIDTVPVEGVDYEIPIHEDYRLSRRSRLDEQCDVWFGSLLDNDDDDNDDDGTKSGSDDNDNDSSSDGILGDLAVTARGQLRTRVALTNDRELAKDDAEWTPYVNTQLPWTPLTPAYGLEQFGLPVPRRNAETWRHFDVAGMVAVDYSARVADRNAVIDHLSDDTVVALRAKFVEAGGWLDDETCQGRLIYINGRFVPQLSKTTDRYNNLASMADVDARDKKSGDTQVRDCLSRLTDGFTDNLAVPVALGGGTYCTQQSNLSGPDHNTGDPTSQFAINTQQGTACFAALNTVHTGAVAYIHSETAATKMDEDYIVKPVMIVNAVTPCGGADISVDQAVGVTCHPRTLVIAEENSRVSIVQTCIDLDWSPATGSATATTPTPATAATSSSAAAAAAAATRPKLYNGYTQIFVKANANVTHSCVEESGGIVTPNVELADDQFAEGVPTSREIEAQRPELRDTHLDVIDVHIVGENGDYAGTMMNMGGSGRVRVAMSVALLCTGSHASVNGFSLSGGAQRSDMKTNIQHMAQGTTSKQVQKNMIGGRSTGSFRGRIRVEQSAQQTDSQQLSRTILLSDKARAWAVPSLEIIADDVQCTHGATVSDLSEEELFYLRSRGLSRSLARNLLMYAFAGDVSSCIDPTMLNRIDSNSGLQQRIIRRLENLVPQGARAVKGDFQSS
jgi:Fe-S cluster assembly scaffold protein SufB